MVTIGRHTGSNWIGSIASGLFYALIVGTTLTVLVAILLTITGINEDALPLYVYLIHGAALIAGGFASAKRAGTKGWYNGGLFGLIYAIIIILISFLGFHGKFSMETLLFLVISFAIGALGGMFGINARR